ncbi:threonine dehydratase [Paucibacter sp. O1-1]|nr:threonine dehydratase [Paucibacter sp. O1-1]MDA3826225.1 threonine dehydratase [Paucibacter sp. O1-1]
MSAALRAAQAVVAAAMPATPQHRWPLLEQAIARAPDDGTQLWVKHENHTPAGAFKVRGGEVYLQQLLQPPARRPAGLVSATRGNHGQSIARAAARHGLAVCIVVPRGNSREKNAAMRALGAELLEHGDDFQAAKEHAQALAAARGWAMVPSFHPQLVAGVASYALELFDAVAGLQRVYVPIGLGSGAAGLIAARDALRLDCEIVGVVSSGAPAYALSLARGEAVSHPVSTELADGMACRTPDPDALPVLARGLARVVQVDDHAVAAAMRQLFEATHQVAEGAGAAAWAAAWAERAQLAGRRTAVVMSGGNVDRDIYQQVLAGTWQPATAITATA